MAIQKLSDNTSQPSSLIALIIRIPTVAPQVMELFDAAIEHLYCERYDKKFF